MSRIHATRRILWPWPPLLLALLLRSASAAPLPVTSDEAELLGISVQTIEQGEQSVTAVVPMRTAIAPDARWAVKSPLPGTLHRMLVQEGDRVTAGDPLAVIHSPAFVELQREYLAQVAEQERADAAWQRDRRLAEAGSIPMRRLEETRERHDSARAGVAGLEGRLRLAGLDDRDLRKLVDDFDIRTDLVLVASQSAVVLHRAARLGSEIERTELLFDLGDPERLVLEAFLPPADAAWLTVGSLLRLAGSEVRARVVWISAVLDPDSQTVMVRAQPDRSVELNPGQLSQWSVLATEPALLVPARAVVRLDGADFVYRAVAGGFEAREVTVRSAAGSSWLVLSGLERGDRVAVTGTAVLKGMSLGMGGGGD